MFYITSDIDWAPEEVIEDFFTLLEQYKVKCTVFATHDSSVIKSVNRSLVEIGVHPNYNNCLNGNSTVTRQRVLEDLLNIYPEAKGVRSHSLVQSSVILQDFADYGLLYEANQLLPYQKINGPYKLYNGLIRIPFNWEDDVHFLYNYSFDDLKLDKNHQYNVLDFHPIHVYLNTHSIDHYNLAKTYYQHPKELIKLRNKKISGTRDIFLQVLKDISESETMEALASKFQTDCKDYNQL